MSERKRSLNSALARVTLVALAVALGGCGLMWGPFEPGYRGPPQLMDRALSEGARQFVRERMADIEPGEFVDLHVHMGSQHIHPHMKAWHRPFHRAGSQVVEQAAAVRHGPGMEQAYIQRLVDLMEHSPLAGGRLWLMALDRYHDRSGRAREDLSQVYVPNQLVVEAARQHPDLFVPVVSIHPHRPDAKEALKHWAEQGVRYVKWLPNTIGIDPGHPRHDDFYQKMHRLNMVLLTHTGSETPLQVEDQEWGNPQRLRRPLDAGVRVVALHTAGNGVMQDLDCPEGSSTHAYKLMLRMLDEPRFEQRLYVETSANTFFNHLDRPLIDLLQREDLHHRIIHGSDYPLPGVNLSTWTWLLASRGYITWPERNYLNEVHRYNPILFDFLVKRTVRHPETGRRFPPEVFTLPADLPDGRVDSKPEADRP